MYKDEDLSESCSTSELIDFLTSIKLITKTGDFSFNIYYGGISADLLLLNTESAGSWSEHDTDKVETNLITIVCTKKEPELFNEVKNILIEIAKYLQWQFIDEHSDDGVDNFVIWKP